ncbi:MAG: DUF1015 domain-containing protein [Deltaproteobacteria bacterium]|nr:DUF1015 domain-containing protein [Deltaproteobacteria bacterium]
MATIKPFKGIRYNLSKLGDLTPVMAPPYDVISPEYQNKLYDRHHCNVIKLILTKEAPGDNETNNKYTRAAKDFKTWISTGILEQIPKPSIFYYTQSYKLKEGRIRTRKGFIALCKLEEFGKGSVFPHEKTLSGPKADRLSLMKEVNANLSCIFAIFPEASDIAAEKRVTGIIENARHGEPMVDVKGDDGVVNNVWKISDEAAIAKVAEIMKDKKVFIADGHHRYETAINYRNYMREKTGKTGGNEPFDYVMMYFASMGEDGLDIFPTHRVVHSVEGFSLSKTLEKAKEYFDITEYSFDGDGIETDTRKRFLADMNSHYGKITAFGLYAKEKNAYYLLKLKDKSIMDKVFGKDMPDLYKTLDVTVLHSLILNKILGISQEDQEKQKNLVYIKDTDEAFKAGKVDKHQAVFIMNATKVSDVQDISEAGLLMPQKSTYFYPKLLSGVIFNPLWD